MAEKPQTALTVAAACRRSDHRGVGPLSRSRAGRRSRLLMTAAVLMACFGGLLWYASTTDWRTLYAGLDPDDARQMAQELTTAGIPFDVSPDGPALGCPRRIWTRRGWRPRPRVARKAGAWDFELFDSPTGWFGVRRESELPAGPRRRAGAYDRNARIRAVGEGAPGVAS